ncbi:MAG: hypothetical protein L0Y71_09500 [Gemmataceae bacterium]|nr:hypothetical protein [Gemmataceae bacterium]
MDEHDPVDDKESVYRRIHRSFFDSSLPIPIRVGAFRPNANDTTGLSVVRSWFGPPTSILAVIDPKRASDYYVVQLAVADLRGLGLTVIPDPSPGGPAGHAVIPELSWPAYQARKQDLKLILVELTKLASAAIVHVAT